MTTCAFGQSDNTGRESRYSCAKKSAKNPLGCVFEIKNPRGTARACLRNKDPNLRGEPLIGYSQWGNLVPVATADRLRLEVIGVR